MLTRVVQVLGSWPSAFENNPVGNKAEVIQILPPERFSEGLLEQVVNVPVPQIQEQMTIFWPEYSKQVVSEPLPQVMEAGEAMRFIPRKRISREEEIVNRCLSRCSTCPRRQSRSSLKLASYSSRAHFSRRGTDHGCREDHSSTPPATALERIQECLGVYRRTNPRCPGYQATPRTDHPDRTGHTGSPSESVSSSSDGRPVVTQQIRRSKGRSRSHRCGPLTELLMYPSRCPKSDSAEDV